MTPTSLQDTLHNRVIGQEEAVVAIAKAVRRARAGLQNPKRPIASFIFCGPTGVGKTELCKALAEAYFGMEEWGVLSRTPQLSTKSCRHQDSMIRLDMSEYMEKHTVAKLIGSPPGYVGYDEESQLTDPVRRKPYSLVLFDEVPILNSFNLRFEGGLGGWPFDRLQGPHCFFQEHLDHPHLQLLKTKVHEQLKGFFRPEFLNRLDEIIVFKSLNKQEVREIAELEFRKTFKRCQERGITLSLTDRYDPVYGARPLRRAIMRLLDDKLAEAFLHEPTVEGECIICDIDEESEVVVLRQKLGQGDAEPVPEEVEVSEVTNVRA
eukprot:g20609.t1